MQSVIAILKAWQPHPFVDHFTIALLLAGIVTDLIGSLFATRQWVRYMALTLMIAGALAAGGSKITGGWEANRVWDAVSGPGKQVLERHKEFGNILPWIFGALAIWRIGVQFIGAIAEFRPIYLLVAIVAGAAIVYQGHLGSIMVYNYGIGTAAMSTAGAAASNPSPAASPSEVPSSPFPSSVPTAAFAPTAAASAAASPSPSMSASPAVLSPTPAPSISPTPISPTPAATPSARRNETPINPPSGESSSPGSSEPQNL